MNNCSCMLDITCSSNDRGFSIRDDRLLKHFKGTSNKMLSELRSEWHKNADIISHYAGERIGYHRTSSNASHRDSGRRPTLKADRILNDRQVDEYPCQCPIKRSKFWFKIASACSARRARRTKFTGSGSPSGNGASLPINRCSTGTTVATYSKIFGSKQIVSK